MRTNGFGKFSGNWNEKFLQKVVLRAWTDSFLYTSNLGKAKGGSFKKKKKKETLTYRKWLCNTHLNSFLLTFLLKSLISLYSSIEISTFSSLFSWNLYFLFIFAYWNHGFLLTFLLEPLLSLYASLVEISIQSFECSTFSWLFYWNLYCLFTFLSKSLPSL